MKYIFGSDWHSSSKSDSSSFRKGRFQGCIYGERRLQYGRVPASTFRWSIQTVRQWSRHDERNQWSPCHNTLNAHIYQEPFNHLRSSAPSSSRFLPKISEWILSSYFEGKEGSVSVNSCHRRKEFTWCSRRRLWLTDWRWNDTARSS